MVDIEEAQTRQFQEETDQVCPTLLKERVRRHQLVSTYSQFPDKIHCGRWVGDSKVAGGGLEILKLLSVVLRFYDSMTQL